LKKAIGVIDSGVGGLTVVNELIRQLPKEKLIYLGDTARCPYGPRSKEEVKKFTWQMVNFLLEQDIKMLVIACNTATAFTLGELREKLDIPVIGVIKPGARAAIKSTRNFQIGIIGTEGTIKSEAYTHELRKINNDINVHALACPLLVPMVEQGVINGDKAHQVVEESLKPMKQNNGIDTLILGCTHYPILKKTIQSIMGGNVTVISSSEETARDTSSILDNYHLLDKNNTEPSHEFYATGDVNTFTDMVYHVFRDEEVEADALTIKQVSIH